MRAPAIKSGDRFHRLTAIERLGTYPDGSPKWLFKCSCGNDVIARSGDVRRSKQKSCGCHKDEQTAARNRANARHGMHLSAEYRVWVDMKRRCEQPNRVEFSYYGRRGISVCPRWQLFDNFFADMGPRPDGKRGERALYSIERINNDAGYEPGNCRWATSKEQAHNRRMPQRAVD